MISFVNRGHNHLFVRPFLVNSLPNAGTHLLEKTVGLFPGIASRRDSHIGHSTLAKLRIAQHQQGSTVPIGVDRPRPASLAAVSKAFNGLRNGHFASGHIPYSQGMADLLAQLRMKSLLILRDPRDVVISHANYVASTPGHFFYERYQTLSQHERIMTSIMGIPSSDPKAPRLLSIHARCQAVLPWTDQPLNYTTYFEKLVGPNGGGSREAQIGEITSIARHLGITYSRDRLGHLADQIFGGTSTFRKGFIGSWKDDLSAEHEHAFKEIAGRLLVELGYEESNDW